MAKSHDPITQHMRRLPCQQSDTVLWWKRQSLRRWRIKTNDMQKHPTICSKIWRLHQRPPNDNVPNAKLKSLYNVAKIAWMLKYGMTKFSPHLINSVLVEARHAFKMPAFNTIRDRFTKKSTPPKPPQINKKQPGMCCLHPSIFLIQVWINKQYIRTGSWAYLVIG